MIKYIDVSGKTEDEAIQLALSKLSMDRDDVSVEILERAKSGFLGIGGTPSDPAEIYVVPLASIKRVELSKSWLENYRHDTYKNMFFDVPTQTLR